MVISKKMGHTSHVGRLGVEGEMHTRFLVGEAERKRSFGRARLRWEDTIKVDRQEIGCGRGHELNSSCSKWDKFSEPPVNKATNVWGSVKSGEFE